MVSVQERKKRWRKKIEKKRKNEIPTEKELQRCTIPSKENPSPQMTEWLYQFQRWSNSERIWAIDRLIEKCEPSRLQHMMKLIEPQFQKDLIFPEGLSNIWRKLPILFPHNSHLTKLIVRQEHEHLLHAGPLATLASLREKYWLIRGKDITRKIIRKCITCLKVAPKSITIDGRSSQSKVRTRTSVLIYRGWLLRSNFRKIL